jgi:V8-like Glu-specific endopeptidase
MSKHRVESSPGVAVGKPVEASAPIILGQRPVVINEIPVTEIPVTEIPVTEIPVTEIPVTEIPVTETAIPERKPEGTVSAKERRLHESVSLSSGVKQPEVLPTYEILPEFREQMSNTYSQSSSSPESKKYLLEEGSHELLDAWYGSYDRPAKAPTPDTDEPTPENVIGPDDRVRIFNTLSFPFSCICHLLIKGPNNLWYGGTGWLVDDQTVITAGHNVFMHKEGGFAKEINVYPGRNGNVITHRFQAARWDATNEWKSQASEVGDYGFIRLNRRTTGLGYFGFGVLLENEWDKCLHVVGYPGEIKGKKLEDEMIGTMWGHGRLAKKVTSRVIYYDTDTERGQSGSPVFFMSQGLPVAVGIHNYGNYSGNSATRITKAVFDQIQRWRS